MNSILSPAVTPVLINKSVVIFDWDGTLFDSTALIASSLCQAANDLSLPSVTMAQARQVIGLGLNEAVHTLVGALSASDLQKFSVQYRRHYFADENNLVFFEGIETLLTTLHARGTWLAVATGKSQMGLMRLFEAHPKIRALFATSRTAEQTASKPHPLMLEEILDELKCTPDDAVMVGDTQFDIDMAHAAGMSSIAVTYGAHSEVDLREAKPDVLVHDVQNLSAVLLGAVL